MLYEKDKDFVRFQRVHTSQNLYYLWKVPSSATAIKLIHFIVKSLTLVPQDVQQTCSYCGQFFKDVFLHIVTSCQTTSEIRNTFLESISHHSLVYMLQILNMKNCFVCSLARRPHKLNL